MKEDPVFASSQAYLDRVTGLLADIAEPSDRMIDMLHRAFEQERTIYLVGNGGSALAASHFGQDLAKGTLSSMSATKRFRAIPLTDNIGLITALANDEGYESVFEQQLRNLGREGDVLVAISGSGNSPNVLRAVEYAQSIGMKTVGITGFDGGKLKRLADECVHVPVEDMGMTEAVHGVVFHLAMHQLRERLSAASR